MRRGLWRVDSQPLGRAVTVARWGHYGRPIVLFPTAGGDALECERFGMVSALSGLIERGRIKLYSTDSVSGQALISPDLEPARKAEIQDRYDAFVAGELVPLVREDCAGAVDRVGAAGASIGACNALNAACRHPDLFDLTVAMSGTYLLDRWLGGYRDQHTLRNTPTEFLPTLADGPRLAALRRGFFLLATGTGRWEAPWETDQIAAILASKAIPHRVEKWGPDAHHDWPTWRTMLPLFLDRLV